MDSSTFRQWLAERVCRFDTHDQEGRSHGHPIIIVHHEGKTAELPILGPHQRLNARVVNEVCEALGLDQSELPGPKSRI